ncbi:E3 ubiquitin-protein ligase CHFR [Morella rubra]|uniref:E3 ubiquitin-protein ligase CHFR n=1 Tax=Morella rubra TaxID=262757 RepID=A0A6A1WQH3_9ROSI|nr:E3 ubiquitin-protein ligase CHFR [Morella rubra]
MTPVCPFVKAARPDETILKKPGENANKHQPEIEGKTKKDAVDSSSAPKCPFGYDSPKNESNTKKDASDSATASPKCPFGYDSPKNESNTKKDAGDSATASPKCPFGYDSQTFKLGPLSCLICQALLFESSRCVPCSHVYCKACISRFKDCPLCGADIEKIEADSNLQGMVDRFIEGHARIKRSHADKDKEEVEGEKQPVIYEDVSMERGAFLVQQAMRAFRAQNVESAKSRLSLCADDIREQLERMGSTSELCSQLGAVLGMLGDCCRTLGDAGSAVTYFEESVTFLSKLPLDDLEITHTLSVSLNKIGDLKYYDGDLQAARCFYYRSLDVRRDAIKHHSDVSSQILDVAISLAKVADVDRSMGNEDVAVDGFQEAIQLLESLKLKSEDTGLQKRILDVAISLAKVADVDRSMGNEDVAVDGFQEAIQLLESLKLKSEDTGLQKRRLSVLEFLKNQVAEKQPDATV